MVIVTGASGMAQGQSRQLPLVCSGMFYLLQRQLPRLWRLRILLEHCCVAKEEVLSAGYENHQSGGGDFSSLRQTVQSPSYDNLEPHGDKSEGMRIPTWGRDEIVSMERLISNPFTLLIGSERDETTVIVV